MSGPNRISIGAANRVEILRRIFGPRLHLQCPDTGPWDGYDVSLFRGNGRDPLGFKQIIATDRFDQLLSQVGIKYLRIVHGIDPLSGENLPPVICEKCGHLYRYWGQSR